MLNLIFTSFFSFFYSCFYNFRFFMHKKSKIIKTRIKKTPTPNLTLYYPLEMSILSVSIRFMGTILLIIFSFCISFFLILKFLDISLELINLIFLLNVFILISTSFYHVQNSLSHFLDDSKNTLILAQFSKIFKK